VLDLPTIIQEECQLDGHRQGSAFLSGYTAWRDKPGIDI